MILSFFFFIEKIMCIVIKIKSPLVLSLRVCFFEVGISFSMSFLHSLYRWEVV